MKNFTLITFCLLYSLALMAQTRTVGGPTQGYKLKRGFSEPTIGLFQNITNVLLTRELVCGITKKIDRKDTLMDSYLRLTLKSPSECNVNNEVLSCISNSAYKTSVELMKLEPESIDYISAEFKIDKSEAKKVYDFLLGL